jgi:hypothetical protein
MFPIQCVYWLCNLMTAAVARNQLSAASGASLHVATWDMELSFHNPAVVTRATVCAPVALLSAELYARETGAGDRRRAEFLSGPDARGPMRRHVYAVEDD